MDYQVVSTDDDGAWSQLLDGSPQRNIFCTTAFLDALGCRYDFLLVCEGDEIYLGALIVKGTDGLPVASPHIFSLYQGIVFSGRYAAMPPHRRVKVGLALIEALLAVCAERYPHFAFSLHHTVEDLRGLQWFNYTTPEKGRVCLQLNYTGIISLDGIDEFEEYMASIRDARKAGYRRGAKLNVAPGSLDDIDSLARLHRLTFERQGHAYNPAHESLLRSIARAAIAGGFGELMIAYSEDGEPAAATLFLRDETSAYYLFGANHPDYRKTEAGTFLTVENIRAAFDRGIRSIDMVGINSPNRGDYKTSLNALPVPYFTASWARPL